MGHTGVFGLVADSEKSFYIVKSATPKRSNRFYSVESVTPKRSNGFYIVKSVPPKGSSGFYIVKRVTPKGSSGFYSVESITPKGSSRFDDFQEGKSLKSAGVGSLPVPLISQRIAHVLAAIAGIPTDGCTM